MASPRTLKIAYPFIRHIPAALAKAKAQAVAARRSIGENNETPPKKKCRSLGLFFPARSEKQQTVSTGRLPVRP